MGSVDFSGIYVRLQRAPMRIFSELMQMFESGTFDISHLEPWLRGFAVVTE